MSDERKEALGLAIKNTVARHRKNRIVADAVLALVEQYRAEDAKLKEAEFVAQLEATVKPAGRRPQWSSRNSRSYRDTP